jgi:16S rRNA (cytosine1402-N4)-methyltransferase
MQLDQGEKGFSFSQDGPLDMRMDPTQRATAEEVVNQWSEEKLGTLFRDLGEEPRWKRAARAIVEARRKQFIATTKQLADILSSALKTALRGKLHPATLVFQALRLVVNKELESVTRGVAAAIRLLSPEGKVGVISFHSLEDRIVKNIFREAASSKTGEPWLRLLTKKPVCPECDEIAQNPRSRSAKLRFAQRM